MVEHGGNGAIDVYRAQFLRLIELVETLGMKVQISRAELLLSLAKTGELEERAKSRVAAAIAGELLRSGALDIHVENNAEGRTIYGTLCVVRDRSALDKLITEARAKGDHLSVVEGGKE